MKADPRIVELEALVAHLRAQRATALAQNEALIGRVQELEARLANATKDSHNSSKPPSSDPLGRKRPRSQRQKRGKKSGGQLGHRGETLHLVATPDELVAHRPAVCAPCQTPLDETAPVEGDERRQVHELPPVRLLIREHRALRVRCPSCERISAGTFPAEAPSRAQYGPRRRALAVYWVEQQLIPYARGREFFTDLFGAHVSLGTLRRWVGQGAAALRPIEDAIKAARVRAAVRPSDETGGRRAGPLVWAHVASTARLTHYAIHPKRGHEATAAIGILPAFRGVSGHDGLRSYGAYTAGRQALCNIHHLRELTFIEETAHPAWATKLTGLLLEMKAAVEQARMRGEPRLNQVERHAYVACYEALMAEGLAANPPPERPPGRTTGRLKQSPARNLLERLWRGQDAVLAFLDDWAIPFDNHQAEQDRRRLTVQQKIAGSFRAESGSEAFARSRGSCASLRTQGVALLAALPTVFTGQPLYPALG